DGASANTLAAANGPIFAPFRAETMPTKTTPIAQAQRARTTPNRRGAAFAGMVTADFVDTERRLASKSLLNALGITMPALSRCRKRTHPFRIRGAQPMRSLAVWTTTTAAVALLGVANAQTPANDAPVDLHTAVTAYAAYHNDVTELRATTPRDANGLEQAL